MIVYHCMVELRSDARALAFAAAARQWFEYLQGRGLVQNWRLLRRTLGLASGDHTDFILEIEASSLDDLNSAFRELGQLDDESARRYEQMHQLIGRIEVGLYRSFPDSDARERIALI